MRFAILAAVAAMTIAGLGGVASAATLPATAPAYTHTAAAPWHYEWQYHYTKWGQYEPGWVEVLSRVG